MSGETEARILALLDALSVQMVHGQTELRKEFRSEVGGLRSELGGLRSEMNSAFARVERRLGNIETRVETLEIDVRAFRSEFERRIAPLER